MPVPPLRIIPPNAKSPYPHHSGVEALRYCLILDCRTRAAIELSLVPFGEEYPNISLASPAADNAACPAHLIHKGYGGFLVGFFSIELIRVGNGDGLAIRLRRFNPRPLRVCAAYVLGRYSLHGYFPCRCLRTYATTHRIEQASCPACSTEKGLPQFIHLGLGSTVMVFLRSRLGSTFYRRLSCVCEN